MDKKYITKFNKIADDLFVLNQDSLKDDEEAKHLSCYLIEIIERELPLKKRDKPPKSKKKSNKTQ
jgi:hypothetical protein